PNDQASSLPVILVNETVARQWWPSADPIGDRVAIGPYQGRSLGTPIPRELVGVAADTKTRFLKEPSRPTVYGPAAQNPESMGSMAWIVRGGASTGLAGVALVLTAIGVYGLLSFSVARRTNEIATRMGLGASRWRVLLLVFRQGFSLIGIALVMGLGAA